MTQPLSLTDELVSLLPEAIPDPGPMADVEAAIEGGYLTDTTQSILSQNGEEQPLWVFAFGSLIWKPRFEHEASQRARIRGWHRSFCLGPDERYRGNPENPGLMLSLDRGGQCQGMAYRLPADGLEAQLMSLLESEPPIPPIWVTAQTADGPVRCIAHACKRDAFGYAGGQPDDEVAEILSRAVGMLGSMPDYLRSTILSLEDVGIHDRYLWRMQALVAEKLCARR